MTYKHMRDLTSYHTNPGCITDNTILQETRNSIKFDLYGLSLDNVMYAEAIKDTIRGMGHLCELLFANCHYVIHQL
jgi:hypothetical protein